MVHVSQKNLTYAHSPDPDDAFMYYGFAQGAVAIPGYTVQQHLSDIESLNEQAFLGTHEITAVSAHAYAYCSSIYISLSCGASVGRGYGPILIRKRHTTPDTAEWKVAIPGKWTTASLMFDLWLAENSRLRIRKVTMPFDEILLAVQHGDVDAGIIIHEGQLTYAQQGLEKVWDAGAWWLEKTGLPLPLGLAVVRRSLGATLMKEIDAAFRRSIIYAQEHSQEAIAYALQYGRGLDSTLGKRFIEMYVNKDTLSPGKDVQKGLQELYDRAHAAKLIPKVPDLLFV